MKKITVLILSCTLLFSCKKDKTDAAGPDIYVCGSAVNNGYALSAVIWKNGVPTFLSKENVHSQANDLFVSGNDVYAAGREVSTNYLLAVYWKNGAPTYLTGPQGSAEALSIYVSGSDVYAAGYTTGGIVNNTVKVAKLWKNGVVTTLSDEYNDAEAHSVVVSGNDVYVAGYMYNSVTHIPDAVIWKNGSPQKLPTNGAGWATSVFVSGNDVYAAGYFYNGVKNIACMWKNGAITVLTDITPDPYVVFSFRTVATSIYVKDNDVYIGGTGHNGTTSFAFYWKNGEPVVLSGASKSSGTAGIAVSGSDVYITGNQNSTITGYDATVWKNNSTSVTILNTNTKVNPAYTAGIFVK